MSLLGVMLLGGMGRGLRGQSKPLKVVHRVAPDFVRKAINRREPLELRSYRGKVVLLNFWATWCEPCLAEMPTFNAWQEQFGSGQFQVIGISMDDAPAGVATTITRLKVSYPVAMGDEQLGVAYGGVLGVPVTFLIDRRGRIRARYETTEASSIRQDIERLLATR